MMTDPVAVATGVVAGGALLSPQGRAAARRVGQTVVLAGIVAGLAAAYVVDHRQLAGVRAHLRRRLDRISAGWGWAA